MATNAGEDTLTLFRLRPGSRLERIADTAAGAHEPRGIVVDGKGRRAYVANFNGGKGAGAVTTFAIEPSGLKLLTAAAATGSSGSEGIALSSDAKALYVANFNTDGNGSITSFPVTSDGLLGPPREPIETGGRQPDLTSITLAR
ncbi:beta-propeller fold lactonase family protein [Kribbella sp. NPDC051718]|uniref:beta-propeller fold lactonase family protein n=1 Tax=Kribbella sp. NPDC051718 TaxID=3155168 RepID=UPI0034308FBE